MPTSPASTASRVIAAIGLPLSARTRSGRVSASG